MATYQTRHLEATREIQHGDKFLKPGDTFQASEVDAEHYIRKGHAKEATAAPAAPLKAKAAPAPAAAAPAPKAAPAPRATPRASFTRQAAPVPVSSPAAPAEPAPSSTAWDVTQPIKLADVPHGDADTSAKG